MKIELTVEEFAALVMALQERQVSDISKEISVAITQNLQDQTLKDRIW